MIKPHCDFCYAELVEFGAILLSPPDESGRVFKQHLCVKCYYNVTMKENDSCEHPKAFVAETVGKSPTVDCNSSVVNYLYKRHCFKCNIVEEIDSIWTKPRDFQILKEANHSAFI